MDPYLTNRQDMPDFNGPSTMGGHIADMAKALIPEYLRPNTQVVDPNAPVGKIPSVEPMNPAPWMAVDLAGNLPEAGLKGLAGVSKGIFAGIGARTANLRNLDIAKGMESVFADPNLRKEIYDATGWFKGPDAKWRFEIPDFDFRTQVTPKWSPFKKRLGDYVHHPQLFEAYPHLKNIEAEILQSPLENGFAYKKGGIRVEGPTQERRDIIGIHELQHKVQQSEGFVPGENAEYLTQLFHKKLGTKGNNLTVSKKAFDQYHRSAGEAEARAVENRMNEFDFAKYPWLSYDVPEGQQLIPFGYAVKMPKQYIEKMGDPHPISNLVPLIKPRGP